MRLSPRDKRKRHRRKAIAGTFQPMPGPAQDGARRKPLWVRREILRLKALMKDAGVRSIAATFNRLHGERASVGKSYVAQLIKTHQYEIACLVRDIRNTPPKPCRTNALWALDCTFHSDTQGRTHAMLGVIDHGSRLLLGLKRITQRNAWTMLGHLCLAIGQHGKPQAIRTDNEAVFKSRLLRIVLKHLRIR
jgi:putative transposase